MKAKQCSYEGCTYVGPLWQAVPKLCKTHAMMLKSEGKPKPVKVYSTISPISEKQAKNLAEYRIVRDQWLNDHPFCEVCGTPFNIQLHHKRGRIGSLLTDTRYMATLCDTHHRKAELNPEWAKSVGLSENRLDKSA